MRRARPLAPPAEAAAYRPLAEAGFLRVTHGGAGGGPRRSAAARMDPPPHHAP
ncbi:hypothetical protein [Streptomyces lavendofoliae]|uniref:hypothetical protein n=1 Tax=Streptomyces lavendofoliae TaxID=67314 RepID=UPI003D905EBF